MNAKKLGFALCGSFCTLERTLQTMEELAAQGWEIQPIMSPITYRTDTRFGTAEQWRSRVEALCGRPIWHTIPQVEPIGPRALLDLLLVAPCTGNTLGKLACGIRFCIFRSLSRSALGQIFGIWIYLFIFSEPFRFWCWFCIARNCNYKKTK